MSFNTDKFSHGYIPIYEEYFNNCKNVVNVLEIGIYNGGSLRYLSNFFPNATIHGIDIEYKKNIETDKIKTYICNQESREELNDFLRKTNIMFDIIIDDGGHTMKQQQTSLAVLFKNLNSGGLYILEDLHTSIWETNLAHGGGFITKDDLITSLDMLSDYKKNKKITSNHMTSDEIYFLESNIKTIEIWTRTPDFANSVTSIIKKI
jgi:23S rRNA U2552 (ribose-2'-O)-methylase RlmE/FtsJ